MLYSQTIVSNNCYISSCFQTATFCCNYLFSKNYSGSYNIHDLTTISLSQDIEGTCCILQNTAK